MKGRYIENRKEKEEELEIKRSKYTKHRTTDFKT